MIGVVDDVTDSGRVIAGPGYRVGVVVAEIQREPQVFRHRRGLVEEEHNTSDRATVVNLVHLVGQKSRCRSKPSTMAPRAPAAGRTVTVAFGIRQEYRVLISERADSPAPSCVIVALSAVPLVKPRKPSVR